MGLTVEGRGQGGLTARIATCTTGAELGHRRRGANLGLLTGTGVVIRSQR